MDELLTVKEASKLLKVNEDKVRELIKKGHIPALKLSSLKIPPWALKEFVDKNVGKDLSDLNNIKMMEVSDGTGNNN